ncbi:MAG: hypothetical protein U0838_09205 [Chloroflexota bacterium]
MPWLAVVLQVSLGEAIGLGVVPFLAGDVLEAAGEAAGAFPAAWWVVGRRPSDR